MLRQARKRCVIDRITAEGRDDRDPDTFENCLHVCLVLERMS